MKRVRQIACQAALLPAALLLGACQGNHAPEQASEAAPASESLSTSEKAILPSPEQQEAAASLLQEGAGAPIPDPAVAGGDASAAVPYASPSGIPGGSGLRMRRFAPPEEASSAGEQAPPAPNTVEQHGLRSPSLPGSLPMDINGKLTGNGAS